MGHSKMSVTVPENILSEIKEISAIRKTKLSHIVTEALIEKIRKIKEEAFVSRVNEVLKDPEVVAEQRKMADDIADNTQVEELPW
jgi:metal-responsive CopG/Arc/MetJ family transcriptional regulator